jgi:transcriptional regulator with XRE-family HTH domain
MMVYMSEATVTTHQGQIPAWTLGWKLKRALDHAGLSAQEMAAELGVHVGTVSRWMNDRETPRRAYVMAWALRCGVSFGWLTETDVMPIQQVDISGHTRRPAGLSGQPEPGRKVADGDFGPPLLTNPDSSSGISASPGHAPVDNDITRLRKRIPIAPALALVLRIAA